MSSSSYSEPRPGAEPEAQRSNARRAKFFVLTCSNCAQLSKLRSCVWNELCANRTQRAVFATTSPPTAPLRTPAFRRVLAYLNSASRSASMCGRLLRLLCAAAAPFLRVDRLGSGRARDGSVTWRRQVPMLFPWNITLRCLPATRPGEGAANRHRLCDSFRALAAERLRPVPAPAPTSDGSSALPRTTCLATADTSRPSAVRLPSGTDRRSCHETVALDRIASHRIAWLA